MSPALKWIVAIAAAMALHSCGSDPTDETRGLSNDTAARTSASAGSTTVGPRETPTCSTFYRTSVTVPPDSGPVLTFTTPETAEAIFTDLHLTATYSDDGYESPSLNVRVETLPDRALLFSSLYQFVDPTAALNAFDASGQGFDKVKDSGLLDKAEDIAEDQADDGGTVGMIADKADDVIDQIQGTKD